MKSSKNLLKGISLVINTKNEEKNIVDCIKSVGDFYDEVVVVDMASTDKTVYLARKQGAKVYSVKDFGYVEPARNFAIEKARYQWILLLDADERATPILLKTLKNIVQEDKYSVVSIPYKNYIFGKWIKHTGWWPDYHFRFFKKGSVKWPSKIHMQAKAVGKKIKLAARRENAVIHYNYNNINQWMEKMNNYTSHESNMIKMGINTVEDMYIYFEREFTARYFLKKGYLDGMHGFVLSKFMEFYRFLEIAKYWEKENYKPLFSQKDLYLFMKEHSEERYATRKIKSLKEQNENLKKQLESIMLSKTYKVWQYYCGIRDSLLRKKEK